MSIDYKLIGERIRKARKEKGITQEKLSEELDVTVAFISRLERGTATIKLKRLAQLCDILEVPIEHIITGTTVNAENYLDKELYEVLIQCTPAKQRLIYNIAKMVLSSNFV